jgi:hypothetical protein
MVHLLLVDGKINVLDFLILNLEKKLIKLLMHIQAKLQHWLLINRPKDCIQEERMGKFGYGSCRNRSLAFYKTYLAVIVPKSIFYSYVRANYTHAVRMVPTRYGMYKEVRRSY